MSESDPVENASGNDASERIKSSPTSHIERMRSLYVDN